MYNACSRVAVSCSALYPGSARDASGQAALKYGRAPKTSVSYRVSGMGHGSSFSSCCFCFCFFGQFPFVCKLFFVGGRLMS